MQHRRFRIADQIKTDVALCVQREAVLNPVLKQAGLVSITEVSLNRDASHATVYFSVLKPDSSKEVADTLNLLASQWRGHIGRQLGTFKVPALQFRFDQTEIVAGRIDALLQQVAREPAVPTEALADPALPPASQGSSGGRA